MLSLPEPSPRYPLGAEAEDKDQWQPCARPHRPVLRRHPRVCCRQQHPASCPFQPSCSAAGMMASAGGGWRTSAVLTLMVALFALEGSTRAERPTQVTPGCHRKGHKVTCRAWQGPDAPDIPPNAWSDFWVLDLSDIDAAKRVDMAVRGTTCHVQSDRWEWRGLGASLGEGRLPARWLGVRYRGLIVLYMRGLGLRSIHRDAFELLAVVQHVYLSSNRLESIDPDMWQHNSRLSGVSLENNVGLQLAEDKPLFRSDNMEYLDLSGCGLRSVPEAAFRELPRLQTLHLERNCLSAVPAPALALVSDLWSLALSENVISGLSADDAALLARLPDALFLVNPWRCDCALRDTLRVLQDDARSYWEQTMADLVCMWPPEDYEQPWKKVLARDTCREFNETTENATGRLPHGVATNDTSTAIDSSTDAGEDGAAAASAAHCGTRARGDDAPYCKWMTAATLVLLALGLLTFTVAAFTDRVAVTVSVSGCARRPQRPLGRGRAASSLSRANLTDHTQDNAEFLHEQDAEGGRPQGAADNPWDVVRFGRGT